MALSSGLRSCASKMSSTSGYFVSRPVSREFHSSGMKMMGGGHGHGEPDYMHAKHMYNLDRMKNRQVKMPLFVFSCFAVGVAVPVYAVIFQQKKTASG